MGGRRRRLAIYQALYTRALVTVQKIIGHLGIVLWEILILVILLDVITALLQLFHPFPQTCRFIVRMPTFLNAFARGVFNPIGHRVRARGSDR